ncbi:MAG: DegT/DnrJ/EryC1/StrS family aminotransferase [Actinobacteria bacterium]|nr:DegT/DnrJ/EryC1/StrS family aminotransferase [Actinomycetota bacterium]
MLEDFHTVFDSGRLTNFGPYATRLEALVSQTVGARRVVSVANATTGLMMVLNTLPPGTEVLLPSFTFLPTAQAVAWNPGLTPVFVDIDRNTYNIDPDDLRRKVSSNTSAILGVHVFGVPCDIDALDRIARDHGLRVFFDSAHALGSRIGEDAIGAFGTAEVFSLSATKVVACGEGGVVATNDDTLHRGLLNRRNYGFSIDATDSANLGLNGKITELSAVLGLHLLGGLQDRVSRRNQIAAAYRSGLSRVRGLRFQSVPDGSVSTYKDFTIEIDPKEFGMTRDGLRAGLAALGIETAPYFSPPIHRMTYFRERFPVAEPLPTTDQVSGRILSLPMFEDMTDSQVERVIESVEAVGAGAINRLGKRSAG